VAGDPAGHEHQRGGAVSTTTTAAADVTEIRRALALLVEPGAVAELRVPTPRGVTSGYYRDVDALVRDAARMSGRAEGVYATLNPVTPALLARSPNRLTERARYTTADRDVVRRGRILVDLDPVRPAGISSTDAEHAAALDRAGSIRDALAARGWPPPLLGDSGNGAHLVYAIALANDDAGRELVKRVLEALAVEHDDEHVTIDAGVHNAARISKVYGTVAAKGADTTERPHRLARILDAPARLEPVARELLAELAALAPPVIITSPANGARGSYTLSMLEQALDGRGLAVSRRKPWHGGTLLELSVCPWAGEAHARTARVILHGSGAVSAACFHASCAGHGWRELREVLGITAAARRLTADPASTSTNGGAAPSPWDAAQPVAEFLAGEDDEVYYLDPLHSLVPGALTEWSAPRGLGKTQLLHAVLVDLARGGKRVLLLDRDNPRREIKRRLRAWGAGELLDDGLRIMTRDETPPLTDRTAWEQFPVELYDVVALDSLDAATEGVGEQDSARPARAIAALLDVAHRADGPACIVLGNTTKSGGAGRGSGVVEDRADIVYEIRDATDYTPTGSRPWWEELPPAARIDWASRATRRRRRDTYRLAIIASKHRVGPEPEPRVIEIDLRMQPWTWRDVTAELVAAGEQAREQAAADRRARLDAAAAVLVAEIERRANAGGPALAKRAAEALLREAKQLTHRAARALLAERVGQAWALGPDPDDARTVLVTRISRETVSTSPIGADPHEQRDSIAANADTRMDTARPHSASENARKTAAEIDVDTPTLTPARAREDDTELVL
jgi:hypothetical protein